LGPKKRLTIRKWQDRTLIDIREYYQDKDNQTKPGKKGISLTPEQFQLIQNHSDEISEVINAMKSTGSAK
ncbi:Transcriptional coactivator, partial [Lunasporangiospora selenospora]